MNIRPLRLIFLSFLLLPSLAFAAQVVKVDIKPGLWEAQSKLVGDSAQQVKSAQTEQMIKAMEEMKSRLASMPPEQRAMMEEVMARQGMKFSEEGLSLQNDKVQVNAEGAKIKQCITQAQLDKGFAPKTKDNCENKLTQLSKNKYSMEFVCTGKEQATGKGEFEVLSNKEYRGTMHMTSLNNGKPMTIDAEMHGQWLGSDCGDIKPDDMDD